MESYNILVLFLGERNMPAGWPYKEFPVDKQITKIRKELETLSSKISDKTINFFGWQLVSNDQDIYESYNLMENAEGLIIVPLNSEFASIGPDIGKLCEKDLPIIVYTKPFSVYYDGYAALLANNAKAVLVASSDPKDLIEPLEALTAVSNLKKLRLLVVRNLKHDYSKIDPRMLDPRWKGPAYSRLIEKYFGSQIVYADSIELINHYENINDSDVKKEFEKIMKTATGVKEPPESDIFKAVKMYLAVKSLMKEKNTNGFTIDCLSYLREKTLPISPCLAISKLNDEGIVAGCEADVETVLTISLCHYLAGAPGFQADPAIDRSKNQVIMAHCTAPTRMLRKETFPFWFRTHNETLSEVGLEVEMKENQPVTILKLIGTGKITYMGLPKVPIKDEFETYHLLTYESQTVKHEYKGSPWGCRTKIAIELSPEELKEFEDNFFGFHRVILYGHYQKHFEHIARFLGVEFHNRMYLKIN